MTGLAPIGLLGGMSWQSTAVYYRELNQLVQAARGGHASAPLVLWSVDFSEIEALQRAGDWDAQGRILADAAARLEAAGVSAVALATNTLHLVSGQITDRITVPFVDMIDVTADASRAILVGIVERLAARGAQAIILGCTELSMSLRDGDSALPLLDTTALHCRALADVILAPAPVPTPSRS
jgi:aspartate/glutamate racemase